MLQTILVVIGAAFILALLGHGLWTIRRNSQSTPTTEAKPGTGAGPAKAAPAGQQASAEPQQAARRARKAERKGRAGQTRKEPEQGSIFASDAVPEADADDRQEPTLDTGQLPMDFADDQQPAWRETPEPDDDVTPQLDLTATDTTAAEPTPAATPPSSAAPEQTRATPTTPDATKVTDPAATAPQDESAASTVTANTGTSTADTVTPTTPSDTSPASAPGEVAATSTDTSNAAASAAGQSTTPTGESSQSDRATADSHDTEPASASAATTESQQPREPEVLTLFVSGDIQGPILLQSMTELGLKFGDMNIFERHVDPAGKGPVLFRVANMYNPGTFDLDDIENLSTRGVALFMTLPLDYDGHTAFNMMYNAANKIAEAMPRAAVLDANRQPLTRQSIQRSYQRIRAFEQEPQADR